MAKKIITSFILLFSLFVYSNVKISIYENFELQEMKINERIISTTIEGQQVVVLLKVGEDKVGRVTSVTLENLKQDVDIEKLLQSKRGHFNQKIVALLNQFLNPNLLSPLSVAPSCYTLCAKKYSCYDKPTESGVLLCAADCLLECS